MLTSLNVHGYSVDVLCNMQSTAAGFNQIKTFCRPNTELPKHSEGGVGLLAIQGSQIPGLDIIRPAHPWCKAVQYRRASESSVVIQRAFLFHNIGHIGDAANVATAIGTAAKLKLPRQKLRFQLNNFCSSGFGKD